MRAAAGISPEAAARAVLELSQEYEIAVRECKTLSALMLGEINALLNLCDEFGDERLHQAVRSRLATLPERMRLASAAGPSAARH